MGLTEYGHIATEETQLRVADLLQAIAAGSAGPEYTDATFKALLDDTNTTEIFFRLVAAVRSIERQQIQAPAALLYHAANRQNLHREISQPCRVHKPGGHPGGRSCRKERGSLGNRQHKPGRLGGGRPHDLVYSRQRCEPCRRNYGRSCH